MSNNFIFPTEIDLSRRSVLNKYRNLYENEQNKVFELHKIITRQYKNEEDIIYIAHSIPAKISDFYGDFVQGNASKIIIKTTGEDKKQEDILKERIINPNDLNDSIYDYAVDQSTYGYVILYAYKPTGADYIEIQNVPASQYFPQSDGSVIFASYLRDPEQRDKPHKDRQQYVYIQHFKLETNGVLIERSAYTVDTFGQSKDKVNLSILNIEEEEEERIEGLSKIPIVQINNGKPTRWGFGKSDYHDILPNLEEVNERVTHVSTQLLKNLDAKLQLPKDDNLLDDEGNLKNFDWLMASKEMGQAKYILNDNPLIEQTNEHIDRQIRFISWISAVPIWEFTKSGMPEKVESLKIQLFSAIRKTETKRTKIVKGIKKIIQVGYELLGEELDSDIDIKFSDVVPSDPIQETQVEETKVGSGLSSKYSSIKRLENYNDEEVEVELEKIKNENIESGVVNPNNAPQI